MPTYEYACGKCGKSFSREMHISEHDRRRPKCPKCGSQKVRQQMSAVFARTSKKS